MKSVLEWGKKKGIIQVQFQRVVRFERVLFICEEHQHQLESDHLGIQIGGNSDDARCFKSRTR